MTTDENKRLVAKIIDEVWNKGNAGYLDVCMLPDFIDHETGADPAGMEVAEEGIAGAKKSLQAFRTAFPDLHLAIDDQVAEGDLVVTRWTASGTLLGPLGRIPATGRKAVVSGIFIDRLENGKLAEEWSFYDKLLLLQQVGAIPAQQKSNA